MSALSKQRRAARQLALDVLYQAEIRDQLPVEAMRLQREGDWSLSGADADSADPPSEEVVAYATRLVEGVEAHSAEIDQQIRECADRWALERMPVLDRSILRVALFELLWVPDVPMPVVINEAVELAKSLSTEDSGRFINGLLGRIAALATGD